MILRPGDSFYGEVITSNPYTAAATNADSLPTATANKNGSDDAGFVLTVTNIVSGRYVVSGTVPGGYVAGDKVWVSVAATVAGILGRGIIAEIQISGADLNDPVRLGLTGQINAARYTGTVSAFGGNTSTVFRTSRAEVNDHWKRAILCFLTGALAGQISKITGFANTNGVITVQDAFTAAPSTGDSFVLINE